ncbi:TRAP transporter large permease [Ciceribacter naphthalenivorans]|uniref:TRAP transporter large permease protein n=3 Tax=Alphaproteobacteria TaxID=28211 RepID=A0A512HH35_9HYPH|nr:TRAP transporter large permease [Ciceribacter naphthalenivorans]GEO84756.1 C4-dicarboxylate ABC transporter permease [Ciceribacter naphthalenivorans]GLR20623.1 C4-dicarboxylate ABC transporter permease [Ciceribacter naphthalenivorans]GLT03479.1 C4-dicarboxylate ABC transporter permease [Sphingomonas psychrolutea]
MQHWEIGMIVLFGLLLAGLPISLALTAVGVLGTAMIIGWEPSLSLLGQTFFDNSRSYSLSILPLFLMMGNFVVQSGVARDLYEAAYAWLRHRRGGLAVATIIACGGFSSVCGSSLATASTMAKISMPSMRRFGYPDGLSTASIAAGGTLGILIPPSVILMFYGLMTQQDIGKLFIAGILPGLIGICLYVLAVRMSMAFGRIELPVEPKLPLKERIAALKSVSGALALFLFVMGGIYLGVFTPTESAGMGAAGAFLLVVIRGRMKLDEALATLYDTAKTTAMMNFILFGALTFANYVNLSGMTTDMQAILTGFGDHPLGVILMITLIYLVLGCVLEGLSMITLTVPIFYPIVAQYGFDLVWFGIYVVIVTEVSYITPPMGLNAFVLRSVVKDVSLSTIFRGLSMFLVVDVARLALILLFPSIVLLLPSLM